MSERQTGSTEQSSPPIIGIILVLSATIILTVVIGTLVLNGGGASATSTAKASPVPSSELVAADGSVFDDRADVCAIDLVVDVAPSERVVIQNEFPGGGDRTVENNGKRTLQAFAPANSTVLIYAVNLDENTSKRLATYNVTDDCALEDA